MIRMGALLWNGLESSFFFLFSTTFVQSFGFLDLSLGIFFGNGSERGQSEKLLHERIVFFRRNWFGLAWSGQALGYDWKGFLK